MTNPEPIAAPPSDLPNVVGAAVQQLMLDPKAYGISWNLRIATVLQPDPLYVVFDGDLSGNGLVVTSMIGGLAIAERVYVLIVPPSGNFVIGRAVAIPKTAGVIYSNVGGFLATSSGVEVAASGWVLEEQFTFYPGQIYEVKFNPAPNPSTANAMWAKFYVRQGQNSTTGTILASQYTWLYAGAGGAGFGTTVSGYCKNTSAELVRTYVSMTVIKISGGAGDVRIYGGETGDPTYATAIHLGPISDNSGVGAMAADVA